MRQPCRLVSELASPRSDSTPPDCRDLVWVFFNLSSRDQAPQEFAEADAEWTFGRVQLQLELPEDIKCLTEVCQVVLQPFRHDNYVVNVNRHRFVELGLKHLGDQPLVRYSCVL